MAPEERKKERKTRKKNKTKIEKKTALLIFLKVTSHLNKRLSLTVCLFICPIEFSNDKKRQIDDLLTMKFNMEQKRVKDN